MMGPGRTCESKLLNGSNCQEDRCFRDFELRKVPSTQAESKSCQLFLMTKPKCKFSDVNEKCFVCIKFNDECGPKCLPSQDRSRRMEANKEKENKRKLEEYIDIRLRRGQSWAEILKIVDPDGAIAPFPEATQTSMDIPHPALHINTQFFTPLAPSQTFLSPNSLPEPVPLATIHEASPTTGYESSSLDPIALIKYDNWGSARQETRPTFRHPSPFYPTITQSTPNYANSTHPTNYVRNHGTFPNITMSPTLPNSSFDPILSNNLLRPLNPVPTSFDSNSTEQNDIDAFVAAIFDYENGPQY